MAKKKLVFIWVGLLEFPAERTQYVSVFGWDYAELSTEMKAGSFWVSR